MAKRSFNEDPAAEALKKVKGEDPEGSWTCPFCQNVNWPKRTTCNKEGCHMPREITSGGNVQHPEGSWACTACANINWPKRTECKKCHSSRGGQKLGAHPGLAGAQPGSWICPLCANVNWPARTVCNKGCGTQKPQQPMYGQPQMSGQMGQQLNQLSQMAGLNLEPYLQSILASTNPYLGNPVGAPAPNAHPPGSWECQMCHNVNWPKRTQCNKPGCGALKPGLESAMPMNPGMGMGQGMMQGMNPGMGQMGQQGMGQVHPEGSWPCPRCNNINWPQRTECNKPDCRTPRP